MKWTHVLGTLLLALGCAKREHKIVILLSVDTLRADRLGAYGSERCLTPNLDALAAQSVVFEQAYAPSSFTLPSVSTILTGRYPQENGIYVNESIVPAAVPTLPAYLYTRGFESGAVVSNYVLRSKTGINQGFLYFDERMSETEIQRKELERSAVNTTRDAITMLDKLLATGSERLLLWVHYQDPHGPYTPPADYLERYLERERARPGGDRILELGSGRLAHTGLGWLPDYQEVGEHRDVAYYLAAYDAEVRYMDAQLGRLIAALRERGLYDDAVIVFVADHGEGLGENDYWFAHGEYLSDPLVRVPLLIRVPGMDADRRSEAVSLVDIVPTLANLVQAPYPPDLLGRDLFASEEHSTVYMATLGSAYTPRMGFIHDGWKLLCDLDQEKPGITDHSLTRVGEDLDLSYEETDRVRDMVDEMNAYVARIKEREAKTRLLRTEADRIRERSLQEDLEHQARLRALGYAGSSEGEGADERPK